MGSACRLRLRVVRTGYGDRERAYLVGYEELTGYMAFNVISPAPPTLRMIEDFVTEIQNHIALPIRRVLLIDIELPEGGKAERLAGLEVKCKKINRAAPTIISPYPRSAEIDLLHRLSNKQNDETARVNVAEIRDSISSFVNQERLGGSRWETPAQRAVTRRLAAEAVELKPYLSMRFKLHRPRRRP